MARRIKDPHLREFVIFALGVLILVLARYFILPYADTI